MAGDPTGRSIAVRTHNSFNPDMYGWGNRHGTEFLGEAVYDGTLKSLLKGFFP
jgi:hypothetical protein